jgi:Bifunctional DNA primase/polymerase, N-terminal/Primase C terminal 1 (PriCT-1)
VPPRSTAATGSASALLVAAAEYAARGWRVLPLREGEKLPLVGSRGVHGATTDLAAIFAWPGGVNVGIACGDGLVVLDVDRVHGGDDSLHELERRYGSLPRTVSVETGNGGAHFYFRTSKRVGCSVGGLGHGLDVRGEGGYVVAPPSLHPNGRAYAWDEHPDDSPLAPLPAWLASLLDRDRGSARPVAEWRDLAANGTAEGDRNNRAAQLAGHLLARDVDPFVVLDLLIAWDAYRNRPPLGREEVTRTVASIARKEARKWRT